MMQPMVIPPPLPTTSSTQMWPPCILYIATHYCSAVGRISAPGIGGELRKALLREHHHGSIQRNFHQRCTVDGLQDVVQLVAVRALCCQNLDADKTALLTRY